MTTPSAPTSRPGRRKPLHESCNGSVTCPVPGHLTARRLSGGTEFSHIPLTVGQHRTLRERRKAARQAATEATAAAVSTPCPGQLQWSAFGATYPDTVCASALTWPEGDYPGSVLCDADDELRPRDVPCPFCDPAGFIAQQWRGTDVQILWASDEAPVPAGTEIHFHDGASLTWTATHPVRGEETVLMREPHDDADKES